MMDAAGQVPAAIFIIALSEILLQQPDLAYADTFAALGVLLLVAAALMLLTRRAAAGAGAGQ